MITNYRPSKPRSKRLVRFALPIVVIGLFYLLSLTSFFQPFERLVHSLARPLWRLTSKEEISLQLQVETLERQLLAARLEHSQLESLLAVFNRPALPRPKTIGLVLARPPESPYDTLVIDVGQAARVSLGDLAVADGAVVLGEVVEVYPQAAKVRLYSWPDYKLSVTVGEELSGVTVLGRGGGNFTLELPRDLEIATGTLITIPELGRELVLGVVGDVDRTASDPFQYVYARLPLNLHQLKQVEIYDSTTFTN